MGCTKRQRAALSARARSGRASSPLLLLFVFSLAACSATWEGLSRDASKLFGSGDEEESEPAEVELKPAQPAEIVSVYEIQRLLDAQGYDPGPIDGVFGDRTARAIRSYQLNNNLAVTGRINGALLEQLRRTAR